MSGRASLVVAVAAALLGPGVALGLSGCGDDGPHLTAAQREGQAAVKRRRIPQGITLSYTETGPAPKPQAIDTFARGKIQCGDWHAKYVAFAYGKELIGEMDAADLDRTAHVFAVREAAPGHLEEVERGCRAGLDTPAAR
jgi:hypothetical protein